MIDLDSVAQTEDGSHFDRLIAVLIGGIALLAALLAFVQVSASGEQARGQVAAARLISEITTRQTGMSELTRLQLQIAQRAAQVGSVGGSRGMAAIEASDTGRMAVADAELAAAQRILALIDTMGRPPAADGPVDDYARSVLDATEAEVFALADDQARQADLAEAAGSRGGNAGVGLLLAALAAVLAGLAGILGDGRAGRLTLLAGFVVAGLVVAALASTLA